MSLLDTLPHLCTIATRKREKLVDGAGSSVDKLVVRDTAVECWEQQMRESEDMDMQKRGIDDARKVYFNSDPQLDESNVIIITSRQGVAVPSSSQKILSVISKPEPDASAGLSMLWRVMCEYRTGSSFYASDVSVI